MKHIAMLSAFAVAGFAVAGFVTAAHAESPSALARQHIEAVASADVTKIMSQYSAGAWLNWVGGPLDGTYNGPESMKTVWTKFTGSQAPLTVKIGDLHENGNPAGTTVTTDVTFMGKAPIKVHYVMLYRGGHLVDETWQIDPKLP